MEIIESREARNYAFESRRHRGISRVGEVLFIFHHVLPELGVQSAPHGFRRAAERNPVPPARHIVYLQALRAQPFDQLARVTVAQSETRAELLRSEPPRSEERRVGKDGTRRGRPA